MFIGLYFALLIAALPPPALPKLTISTSAPIIVWKDHDPANRSTSDLALINKDGSTAFRFNRMDGQWVQTYPVKIGGN